MASTPKGPQKMRLDYNIDRDTYNQFVKKCTEKGYAPNIIIERLMKRYVETGQF
ncbi:MAG: hypothetical protein KJ574_05430 [Nanoarchaeota archaeon]|nr:hypothetical protein [Nanoarchaeota archaeon]